MASKLRKTLADYAAIAVSPALIMVLVGSLVFFVLEASYHGQFESRLRWILFWFVFASVLIARVAIEQGPQQAQLYGLTLAVATGLVVFQFADRFLLAWLLLAVVWWCANKLTWDCTLIDDTQDASGQGLLQVAGVDADPHEIEQPGDGQDDIFVSDKAGARRENVASRQDSPAKPTQRKDKKPQPHAPGLWVVYFSLAALPLFGLGQLLIPADEPATRQYAFTLLFVYVAAALGLLLTTSFLGLRRYLRQRRLKMPSSIAGGWIGIGTFLIAAILAACVLLPRPDAQYSIGTIGEIVESAVRKASRHALLRSNPAEGEAAQQVDRADPAGGRRFAERRDDDAAGSEGSDEESSEDDPGGADLQRGNSLRQDDSFKLAEAGTGEMRSSDSQSDEGNRDKPASRSDGGSESSNASDSSLQPHGAGESSASKAQQPSGEQLQGGSTEDSLQQSKNFNDKANTSQDGSSATGRSPQSSTLTQFADSLGTLAKWLFYAVIVLFVLWLVIRNLRRLIAALGRLWESLRGILTRLIGGEKKDRISARELQAAEPFCRPAPFAAFQNPFASGRAESMQPEELVRYTFEALQAWARERDIGRSPEETPLEFSRNLSRRVPALSKEIDQTVDLYARAAYGSRSVSPSRLSALEHLWRRLSAVERPPSTV